MWIGIGGLIIGAIGVIVAILQLRAARRAAAPAPTVAPPAPAPEPAPYFITQAELDARVRELRMEWEFRGPTPEGAQRYLQEGWERDRIDGHPVVMGGTLERADN